MKELQKLIKRVEVEINKTPTGELRNLLCDVNIMLQQQALNIPVVSKRSELLKALNGIIQCCDGNESAHEHIYHIANDAVKAFNSC